MDNPSAAHLARPEESLTVDLAPLLLQCSSGLRSPTDVSASALARAASEHGYAHASGHGIPSAVTSRLFGAARSFFESASWEERARVAMHAHPGGYRGFQPIHANVTEGRPDNHQAIDYMRSLDDIDGLGLAPEIVEMVKAPNVYPAGVMEEALREFVQHAVRAGIAVMRGVAISLGLHPTAFEDDGTFSDPFWIIRLIHYPAIESSKNGHAHRESKAEELGCGAHRDYGFVTFVAAETSVADVEDRALQVLDKNRRWVPAIKPAAGDFLVNFGDCLEAVTSGKFPATLHRVMRPTRGDRLSIAVFIEPNFNWKIQNVVRLDLQQRSIDAAENEEHDHAELSEHVNRHLARVRKLQRFACYGEYLYSKVSTNFDYRKLVDI